MFVVHHSLIVFPLLILPRLHVVCRFVVSVHPPQNTSRLRSRKSELERIDRETYVYLSGVTTRQHYSLFKGLRILEYTYSKFSVRVRIRVYVPRVSFSCCPSISRFCASPKDRCSCSLLGVHNSAPVILYVPS